MAHKKLYRDVEHSSIGGVASGLADFFDMDITIFRVLFVITAIFAGGGVALYIILWIVVPPKPVIANSQPEVIVESTNTSEGEDVKDIKNKYNKNRGITGGLILIILGVIFLTNIFIDIPFRNLWPILVITMGVIIVVSGFANKKS